MAIFAISKTYNQESKAKAAVLSVPYERTVSYFSGCASGPKAIVDASKYVELFDEELQAMPHKIGIMEASLEFGIESHEDALLKIGQSYSKYFLDGKFVVALGGEHSITIGIVRELAKHVPDFSVVHFDAHADLRNYYGGTMSSHACVMRRIHDLGISSTSLGIRSMSGSEHAFHRKVKTNILLASKMHHMCSEDILAEIADTTLSNIYITFDVDYFSSDVIPYTGTPEPGGLPWYKTLEILKGLFSLRNVIGADIVELVGKSSDNVGCFNSALLLRKMLGYKFFLQTVRG